MASILEKIAAHLQTHSMAAWEGTFRDYLSLVLQTTPPGTAGARTALQHDPHRWCAR